MVVDLPCTAPPLDTATETADAEDPDAENADVATGLPDFLLLQVYKDVDLREQLAVSGGGRVYRARLLTPEAVVRNANAAICAAKEIATIEGISEDDRLEQFYREVSILWALARHPNVVRLVGFCVEPERLVVTRLYKTDLYRFLHKRTMKGRPGPLPSYHILYLCVSMAAAVAAVHDLDVAHREIKTHNFLLDDAVLGSVYADPVLCDFGLARTPHDSFMPKLTSVSARYAAPEVFARTMMAVTSNTLEDDKAAAWSFGRRPGARSPGKASPRTTFSCASFPASVWQT